MQNSLENRSNHYRVIQDLNTFSKYGTHDLSSAGVTRLAYTDEESEAQEHFIELCKAEGMHVRKDSAGNIIARRNGTIENAPAVACGSHLDTVINGGKYDGTLGVFAGLEIIRMLNEQHIQTEHPIELISFASEESSRFGVSTIGSKAMAGIVDIDVLSSLKDHNGISFQEALSSQELDIESFALAKRSPHELMAFIEMHIEQGPLLETKGHSIGLVSAIAAPTRFRVEVEGKAGHSGTTIMSLRKDALVAASEIVLGVEDTALQEEEFNTVGTVGVCNVSPGAANTIPGKVDMIVEFRSADYKSKKRAESMWLERIKEIENRRYVQIKIQLLSDEKPVKLDSELIKVMREVCEEENYSYLDMVSGAGHDAMNLETLCPVGLIFVPSVNGISHHPEEFTHDSDIFAGIRMLYDLVLKLAKEC